MHILSFESLVQRDVVIRDIVYYVAHGREPIDRFVEILTMKLEIGVRCVVNGDFGQPHDCVFVACFLVCFQILINRLNKDVVCG